MRTYLYIDNGRVGCPRRGDRDIEYCIDCPDFVDIVTEDGREALVCRGGRPSLVERLRPWHATSALPD